MDTNLSLCSSITYSLGFANVTASYAQQLHDANASTISASFIMFILTAVFFILNLFSRLSDASAILDPNIRVGLTSAFSIFLPVMSYLFSEAKNTCYSGKRMHGLPQRARFILIWMLLIELLRKKVEVIRMQGYSGTIERAGRVIWLGSLVFSNPQATGTCILWMLCACKLVQRIAFTEFGKRSLALGKNARLISSYMTYVLEKAHDQDQPATQCLRTDELLKRCKYAVMDEEKLVVEAVPNGYKFREDDGDDATDVATVGKIWEAAESDPVLASLDGRDWRLRRLCLSFSLFKLLRRRFEHLPAPTAEETRSYRQIMFRGLRDKSSSPSPESVTSTLLDVTDEELGFLCEYYHSVIPVVLASPFFLLANYLLFPVVVLAMCATVIIELNNGNFLSAVSSVRRGDYSTFFGVMHLANCLPQVFKSPTGFLSIAIDFFITFLLFVMLVYEEVQEILVFLRSDWFLVSLICKYVVDPLRQNSRRTFRWSVRCILFERRLVPRPSISFNQFSVLNLCGVTMPAHVRLNSQILCRPVPVPKQVKHAIADYFTNLYDPDGNNMVATLSNGTKVLLEATLAPRRQSDRRSSSSGDDEPSTHQSHHHPFAELSQFCECGSVAEVILTWHIATCMLEVKHPHHQSGNFKVATSLSKYCAYLVAFHPELLPDKNPDGVNRVFEAMKLELFQHLGFWGYYLSPCSSIRYRKLESCSEPVTTTAEATTVAAATKTVVVRGATLGSKLASKAEQHSKEAVWNVLADLWVELLVYVAPSSDEECVGAHQNALAKGGEFITVLWAVAAHAGVTRPDDAVPVYHTEGVHNA